MINNIGALKIFERKILPGAITAEQVFNKLNQMLKSTVTDIQISESVRVPQLFQRQTKICGWKKGQLFGYN